MWRGIFGTFLCVARVHVPHDLGRRDHMRLGEYFGERVVLLRLYLYLTVLLMLNLYLTIPLLVLSFHAHLVRVPLLKLRLALL